MKAIILCAGKGERLKPLTNNIPKPMLEIAGKPMLEYNLRLCKKHNITDIAINTSYLPEKIKKYFGTGDRLDVNLNYSYEKELLGTAGALNNFKNFLNETFAVIYGDNLTDINLKKMLKYHSDKKTIATIFLQKEKNPDKKTTPGVMIINKDLSIKSIIENPSNIQQKEIRGISEELKYNNSGIYILEPEIFNYLPQGYSDFAKDIFPKVLAKEKIFGYLDNCFYSELGAKLRYKKTKKDIESGNIQLNI